MSFNLNKNCYIADLLYGIIDKMRTDLIQLSLSHFLCKVGPEIK